MPSLSLTTRDGANLKVDALVVGSVSSDGSATLAAGHGLPKAAARHLADVLTDLEAKGEPGEVARVVAVPGVSAKAVVVTGLGEDAATPDVLRSAAATALRSVATKSSVAVALPTPDVTALAAVADGAYAGCYSFDATSTKAATGSRKAVKGVTSRPRADVAVTIVSGAGQGKDAKAAVTRAGIIGAARDFARDLVNTPPNLLTPQAFVERVKAAVSASSGKVSVSVLDEAALAKGGFGGIVGVGQGSVNPPRIVTMTYSPSRARGSVALVGKGITFDSGGLCIKPPAGMATMKCDMAGAAAVAGAVLAAAELGGPVAVTGYLCLAENMPSGSAQRPGDVVTMRNGMSVEILDTDAEGRMVLGDGMALACESSPDVLVDIATLTGAQMVALGNKVAGVMGNDDDFRSRVVAAGAAQGEDSWPMPLPRELRAGLDSTVADIAHKADRWGGMLTAGLFLQEFVGEGIPWAHVDIAGPAFNEKGADGLNPKGGTGYGVATLVGVIEGHGS